MLYEVITCLGYQSPQLFHLRDRLAIDRKHDITRLDARSRSCAIDVPNYQAAFDIGLRPFIRRHRSDAYSQPPLVAGVRRITSYNVCYTKLLRSSVMTIVSS